MVFGVGSEKEVVLTGIDEWFFSDSCLKGGSSQLPCYDKSLLVNTHLTPHCFESLSLSAVHRGTMTALESMHVTRVHQ